MNRMFSMLLGALCFLLMSGCQSTSISAQTDRKPISWPARALPGSITLGDVSGIPIKPYGHHGHGHVAGWHRPGKGPLSMLTVTTRGLPGTVPEQGMKSLGMTISGSEILKGSARLGVSENERTTAAFVRHPEKPRGIAILLTSLSLFSKPESKLFDRLAERQWVTVAITSSSDLMGLTHLPKVTSKNASRLGKLLNHHLAERAYATEAVLRFLTSAEPSLASLPKVVIGASLGALAAPATVTRLEGGADAIVLIGGGTDVASIAVNSSLRLIKLDPSIRAQEARGILKTARQETHLDPGTLAPHLADTPRLLVDGRLDHIVPSVYGQKLYHALGKPERWRYPAGHLILFSAILPMKIDAIIDWVESEVN